MAVDLRKETYSALSRRPAQIMQIPIKEDVIVPDRQTGRRAGSYRRVCGLHLRKVRWKGSASGLEENWSLRYCIWGMEIPARYIV